MTGPATLPAIAYYNRIAGEYDGHMTDSDRLLRRKVSGLFSRIVSRGNVLDFGGGTGLDLPWLLDGGYQVFFLEPSPGMRKIARRSCCSLPAGPVFLEEDTDIRGWSQEALPFTEKMQGILANFAVLNCLEDVKLFFEKIALVAGEGCQVVALVLDPSPAAVLSRFGMRKSLLMSIKGAFEVPNNQGAISHKTYIRSIRRYRRAAGPYFKLTGYVRLVNRSFSLLVLQKCATS